MLTYYKHPSQFGNIFIYWKRSKCYSFNYNNSLSPTFVNIFLVLFPLLLYETTFLRKVENLYPITALICQERWKTLSQSTFSDFADTVRSTISWQFQIDYSPPTEFLYFSLVVNIWIQGEAFSGECTQFYIKVKWRVHIYYNM